MPQPNSHMQYQQQHQNLHPQNQQYNNRSHPHSPTNSSPSPQARSQGSSRTTSPQVPPQQQQVKTPVEIPVHHHAFEDFFDQSADDFFRRPDRFSSDFFSDPFSRRFDRRPFPSTLRSTSPSSRLLSNPPSYHTAKMDEPQGNIQPQPPKPTQQERVNDKMVAPQQPKVQDGNTQSSTASKVGKTNNHPPPLDRKFSLKLPSDNTVPIPLPYDNDILKTQQSLVLPKDNTVPIPLTDKDQPTLDTQQSLVLLKDPTAAIPLPDRPKTQPLASVSEENHDENLSFDAVEDDESTDGCVLAKPIEELQKNIEKVALDSSTQNEKENAVKIVVQNAPDNSKTETTKPQAASTTVASPKRVLSKPVTITLQRPNSPLAPITTKTLVTPKITSEKLTKKVSFTMLQPASILDLCM